MRITIPASAIGSATPRKIRYWLTAVAAALISWGCLTTSTPEHPGIRPLPMETIWAGTQCGCQGRQPQVRWLTDPGQLAAAVAAGGSTALEARVASYPMDWKRDGLVWIDMGLKPSGGYALSLASPAAIVSAGTAVITVKWRQPRPGSVVTQQLTSPCLLLKLARKNFHTIRINDEAGRMQAGLEVNGN